MGESIAVKFLEGKGYKVLARNYLKPWGEIDIIVEKERVLHFVEVKTVTRQLGGQAHPPVSRASETAGFRAEDNVHEYKLKRLERTINSYLMENKKEEGEWQLNLVVVSLDVENKKAKVKFLGNIF